MPRNIAAGIAAVAMLALVLFSPAVLNDGDTFSHLAAGDWMIAHRAVLHADPFSLGHRGAPWVAHEWLAEIMFAAAFHEAGWNGVVVLTAMAAALAFFQLGLHLARSLPSGATLIVLVLAAACVTPGLLARPHILALPVFEAWVAGLVVARSRGLTPSWLLLPLMCLWANLHGGFIIGLVLVVPLALEAMLADPAGWRSIGARWGSFLVAATGMSLVSPHGLAGLLLPFRLSSMPELAYIGEWQPTNFSTLQPLELLIVIGLYMGLSRGARMPPLRFAIALGLLHMALQHSRHLLLVGMIVPLLIADALGAALPAGRDEPAGRRWWIGGVAMIAVLLAVRLFLPVVRVDGPSAPMTALAHVPAALQAQPVFNDYAFGGYLIFSHVRPFIDARAELYGPAALRQYLAIIRPNMQALTSMLKNSEIRWTILSPANPAVALLDTLPGWCRLYADDTAVVHTQSCP